MLYEVITQRVRQAQRRVHGQHRYDRELPTGARCGVGAGAAGRVLGLPRARGVQAG